MRELMLTSGGDLQVYLFFTALFTLIGLQRLIPLRHPQGRQMDRWRTNAGLTLLVILSMPLVPVSFMTAAFWAEHNNFGLLNAIPVELPTGLVIVLTLVVRSFVSFLTHFLNHKLPLLWRVHRVHHFDTELDVSTTVRFHPIEMLIALPIGLPFILLFGLSPWVLVFYELLDVTVTLFSHSNIRLSRKLDRWLRYVIVTPNLHRVHHSTYQPETDSNYSAVFPIWDIFFRTFRTETREPQDSMAIGLKEIREPKANRFWWLLVSPVLSLEKHTVPATSNPSKEIIR